MSGRPEDGELAALLDAMLSSSLDAVITIDSGGRVIVFNPAAERTFGYRSSEAIGRDVAELIIPPALRERHRHGLTRQLETGESTILNRRVEVTGMRSDGSEFPVELTVTRVAVEGPAVFTAYLRDIRDRKQAEAELLESRARVVETADRERRRIERNLHDGAQQRLIAISLFLNRVADDDSLTPRLQELVRVAQDEAGRAIEEIRELARGIHPGSLTESGLATAVRGLALRLPLDVSVDIPEDRLPESVETAFYYVAAEALTNVVKYAAARSASVRVEHAEGVARAVVTDDGIGGADAAGGSGIAGLRDRLEAIGGTLEVASPAGCGTTVTATVPLADGQGGGFPTRA